MFARHGLRLDIKLSFGLIDRNPSYPYITATSWIKCLDAKGCLGNLLGTGWSTLEQSSDTLLDFWQKYKLAHGDHEVYALADSNQLDLQNCVPVYIHGDEGTTFKKDGALVLSFFSPLGKGAACQRIGDIMDPGEGKLHMNLKGHCFKTRFIMATLFKASDYIKIMYSHAILLWFPNLHGAPAQGRPRELQ